MMSKHSFHKIKKSIEAKILERKIPKSFVLNFQNALYRNTYFNFQNMYLVSIAKRKDFKGFEHYLDKINKNQSELCSNENFEILLNEIKSINSSSNILDVNCGNCRFLNEVQKLGHNAFGVDTSKVRIEKNKQGNEKLNLFYGFTENLPIESDSIDVLIATGLLERVLDLEKTLLEFKRVLKKNGKLFIQVPNKKEADSVNHIRLFDADTLNYWVRKYFKVENIELIPNSKEDLGNNIFLTATNNDVIDVEFYLMDAFEIYHFLPIFRALTDLKNINPKFICEPPEINTHSNWFDYETALSILNELNLDYSFKANPYARIAFSTQHVHTLRKYKNIKINLQYGAGLNKSNFCSTVLATEGYDYRFVYARYTTQKVSKYMKRKNIYEIGLPKHDSFFNNRPLKESFDTKKPILAYFPTWDEDCSVNLFYEELKKLKEHFFVVTKAHHCSFRLDEKKNDLEKIYTISDVVLEGNYDFAKAAILGDIAIIDAKSGASTEIPYLNPNIKILYLSPRNNLKKYFSKNIFEIGYFINKPEKLVDMIKFIYKNDKYIKRRKKNISHYMGKQDGKSTQRAVIALKDIISKNYGGVL